ncbi:integral membrane protein [Microbacterium pygmaeum]|uniref:Integral membrane protein n=1 Tax=Microbacterium pygmaeum TaxID=370764 RepID=A0A1G7YSK8_9MICO|nr:integral membrane protein [Microbacterium pygmaeum]
MRTPLNLFRVLAIAEVVSWTLLITGLVVRATTGLAIAVTVGGGIHGFVFLAYGATAVLVAKNQRWSAWPTTVAVVSAVIPYATIPTELWLHRTGRLAGAWRIEETADPRDRAWHDRAMRVLLRRPWLLAVLLGVAVAGVFTVLLVVGPPGGRD